MKPKLTITYRPTSELIPYARNSRTHSDIQISQIAASIQEFGFTNPVLIDEKGIIAGHGRIMGARKLGMEEVPTITLHGLSESQRKAYIIADNRLALNAGWDDEMLRLEIADLKEEGFDLDLLGFEDEEIAALEVEIVEGQTDPDEVPEPPEDPVTVLGDIWTLGNHRLMCGDSTSIDAVEKLMETEKAETFFTDPPYGDNVGGLRTKAAHEREKGKGLIKRVTFIENDKEIDWLEEVFNLVPTFLEEENTKMVFFKWDRFEQIKKMAVCFGEPTALCVWDRVRKASAFFRFQPQHELCFHWGNQADKKEQSSLSNVWRVAKELENNDLHPTVKPQAIIEPVIRVTTSPRKIVLDLFGGSGSTLIACEKTSRKARLMELAPNYCDVIIKRWQDFTGKKAVHDSGKTFDEMAASRGK
jgi:DNA modification methylase